MKKKAKSGEWYYIGITYILPKWWKFWKKPIFKIFIDPSRK